MLIKNDVLTHRERVLKTLDHEKTDRVPLNYMSNPLIHQKLMNYFNAKNNKDLNDAIGVDFYGIGPRRKNIRYHDEIPNRRVDPFNGTVTRYVEHESGGYWDYCDFPLEHADYDDIKNWKLNTSDDYDYSLMVDEAKAHEEYSLVIGGAGTACIINTCGMIRGMEQVLVDLITDNEAGLLLIDRILDEQLETMERALDIVGDYIDIFYIGEDLGTQHTPLIGRNVFDKHILPRHKKFFDLAKSYNLKVKMHNCGSSSWAFEDYIKLGLDIAETLQPEAANTGPRYLVDTFGGRLCFEGCISTAKLAFDTADEIETQVKETLDIMSEYGGYICAPTHQLQDNTPLENVIRMYQTAHDYR